MNVDYPLVSATWLSENINHPKLICIDASLKNPVNVGISINMQIIPRSVAFDWEKFSDLNNPLPHTMPQADQFTQAARELGICSDSLVVVYDRAGIYSSARVWWMFLAMGFQNCFVLDGGLPEWNKMGYTAVSTYEEPKENGNFKAHFRSKLISSKADVSKALPDRSTYIIDARSADRFHGRVPEPRKGLRTGNIPNSINIPFENVLVEHKLRDKEELEQIFSTIPTKHIPLIFSCGSGVTACIDALAATVIGFKTISIYDGSWSEWGEGDG